MGTLSDKKIKKAIATACKAMKILGERDTRTDRAFDGESFGINFSAEPTITHSDIKASMKIADGTGKTSFMRVKRVESFPPIDREDEEDWL